MEILVQPVDIDVRMCDEDGGGCWMMFCIYLDQM